MTIRGKWLCRTWTDFHHAKIVARWCQTLNTLGQVELCALVSVTKQCFGDLLTAHYSQFNTNHHVAVQYIELQVTCIFVSLLYFYSMSESVIASTDWL